MPHLQLDGGWLVMLQIRHVPEELHRVLEERAARAGQSLSDEALAELAKGASRPTLQEQQELQERIAARPPVETGGDDVVQVLHDLRREREEHLGDPLSRGGVRE